jgi:hypothetical protein
MNAPEMINFLKDENNKAHLTDWENRFVADFSARYDKNKRCSPAQRQVLDKMINRINLLASGQMVVDNNLVAKIDDLIAKYSNHDYYGNILFSFKQQVLTGKTLTENQMKVVEQAEIKFAKNEEFLPTWDDEKKSKFEMAVKFYKETPYYSNIVKNFYSREEYIPTLDEYNKVVENKYFVRIWDNWTSEPKYKKGQVVTIRSGTVSAFTIRNSAKLPQDDNGKLLAFVVDSNVDVPKAVKGGKIYKVLFFGSSTPINLQESVLKIAKM